MDINLLLARFYDTDSPNHWLLVSESDGIKFQFRLVRFDQTNVLESYVFPNQGTPLKYVRWDRDYLCLTLQPYGTWSAAKSTGKYWSRHKSYRYDEFFVGYIKGLIFFWYDLDLEIYLADNHHLHAVFCAQLFTDIYRREHEGETDVPS